MSQDAKGFALVAGASSGNTALQQLGLLRRWQERIRARRQLAGCARSMTTSSKTSA
jgi:hypothetical protein